MSNPLRGKMKTHKHYKGMRAALATIDAQYEAGDLTESQHQETRIKFLAEGGQHIPTEHLGAYCRDLGASSGELGKLLLDRAARKGIRPKEEIIQYPPRNVSLLYMR